MKRTMFFSAALLALATFFSCQKQQDSANAGIEKFTACIEQPPVPGGESTKTAISDIKVSWREGDEITITDKNEKKGVYAAQSGGASTTLIFKSGVKVSEPPFNACYGELAQQKYDADGANCPFSALNQQTTDLRFRSPYAIVRVEAATTGGTKTVTSVTVAGTTLDCGKNGVELNTTPKYFYVSIIPRTYIELMVTFTASDKTVAVKRRKSDITLAANDLLCLPTFELSDWKDRPDGALSGKFSVSNDGGETVTQVWFSQGNLWYNGSGTFFFEDDQWATQPSGEGQQASGKKWVQEHISHFFWSKDASKAYAESYDDPGASYEDIFFTNSTETAAKNDFSVIVREEARTGIWRTLSKNEWKYLIEHNGCVSVTIKDSEGKNVVGSIIFCDEYQGPKTGLTSIPEGCVFLPEAGYRHWDDMGKHVVDQINNNGYYVSSSPDPERNSYAHSLVINDAKADVTTYERNLAHCIRLVVDCR